MNDKICETNFKEKFNPNLKAHLKTKHPQQYQELIQKEKNIIKEKESALVKSKRSQCNFKGQQTLTQVLKKGKKYERDHPQYKQITKQRKATVHIQLTLWTTG